MKRAGTASALAVLLVLVFFLPMVAGTAAQSAQTQFQLALSVSDINPGDQGGASGLFGLCFGAGEGNGAASGLSGEQLTNANIIINWVADNGYPQRAAVIAVATAMQESSLINVDFGDEAGPDSRGLFQQRLQFYGALGDPMDPQDATRMFVERLTTMDMDDPATTDVVETWDTLPLTVAAQNVQISAHPDLYAQHEPLAVDLVSQMWSLPCPTQGPASVLNGYVLPLAQQVYDAHPEWFTRPHHDYPSIDIPVQPGTALYAVHAGVVQWTSSTGKCGYGYVLRGDDGNGYVYCHLNERHVPDGVRVSAGTLLGLSGGAVGHPGAGSSRGPHLHFDMRIGGTTSAYRRCPQEALVAWGEGVGIDLQSLTNFGCYY